ncbi:hypothetical protein R3P38DRAFT_2902853 [Favolaschia claudopus]|uniref:phytol kinase n=1 Tax=Favolaschia claudopus TaxID=2862362 RepID=A0AAW0CMC7_9AGAR
MHSFLRLSNLDSLPFSLRRYAVAAANGSVQDLQHLIANLNRWHDNPQFTRSLPVFYAALDPVNMAKSVPVEPDSITNAFLSLHSLRKLEKRHHPVFGDLWPRIWLWISFFTHHPESIPDFRRSPICLVLLDILSSLTSDEEAHEIVWHTSGVRSIVMEAWQLMKHPRFEDPEGNTYLSDLFEVVHEIPLHSAANFDEIVDTAGGIRGIARLVMDSIFMLFDFDDRVIIPDTLQSLSGIMAFLNNLGSSDVLAPALVAAGAVSVFTCMASAGIEGSSDDVEDLGHRQYFVLVCIHALHSMLPSYRAMRASLQAGLLRCLLYGSILSLGDLDSSQRLRKILKRILPASTVYYSVLLELRQQLPGMKHITESPAFKMWDLYGHWVTFENLARSRIDFMEEIERSEQALKACSNTECGKILDKHKFKRCSQCRHVQYCSADCQKTDWRRGGHRTACRAALLFDLANQDLTPRNLSFMRKLLHRDLNYDNPVLYISSAKLSRFRELALTNDASPFVTVFDYRSGHSRPYITDVDSLKAEDSDKQVNWEDYTARVARSGGRMELHLIRAQHGCSGLSERMLMVPQYSEQASIHHGMLDILRRDDGIANWDAEVMELVTRCEGILKVH